jgi:hypothetical protein
MSSTSTLTLRGAGDSPAVWLVNSQQLSVLLLEEDLSS